MFFNVQNGNFQTINSSFVNYLSAKVLAVETTNIKNFTAQLGSFSTVSTGAWKAGNVEFSSLSFYDEPLDRLQVFTVSSGFLMQNSVNFLSNTIVRNVMKLTIKQEDMIDLIDVCWSSFFCEQES